MADGIDWKVDVATRLAAAMIQGPDGHAYADPKRSVDLFFEIVGRVREKVDEYEARQKEEGLVDLNIRVIPDNGD